MCPQAESGADTVYSLKFNTRKSDCLAGSEKPWTDCDYHPENEVTVRMEGNLLASSMFQEKKP